MKTIFHCMGLGLAVFASQALGASANSWETGTVNEIRTIIGNSEVSFSLGSEVIHNGCSGDDSFYFDATTSSGQNSYKALLTAKQTGQPVNIYITNLRASGGGGCSYYQWNVTVLDVAP